MSLVETAVEAIDRTNAADPNTATFAGVSGPKEVIHAQRMSFWLERLDPDPSDAQRIAARAHHLRRWEFPRSEFPEGRAGYLKWRRVTRERHAELVGELLAQLGASPELGERVGAIVSKTDVGTDPQVQTHEDALCLVFFEQQVGAVAQKLGDKAQSVVEKTVAKMSDEARMLAAELDLDESVASVIALSSG